MKREHIKITWREALNDDRQCVAQFQAHAVMTVDKDELRHDPNLSKFVEDQVKKMVAREVFGDIKKAGDDLVFFYYRNLRGRFGPEVDRQFDELIAPILNAAKIED